MRFADDDRPFDDEMGVVAVMTMLVEKAATGKTGVSA